jgi:hypothetical protein
MAHRNTNVRRTQPDGLSMRDAAMNGNDRRTGCNIDVAGALEHDVVDGRYCGSARRRITTSATRTKRDITSECAFR